MDLLKRVVRRLQFGGGSARKSKEATTSGKLQAMLWCDDVDLRGCIQRKRVRKDPYQKFCVWFWDCQTSKTKLIALNWILNRYFLPRSGAEQSNKSKPSTNLFFVRKSAYNFALFAPVAGNNSPDRWVRISLRFLLATVTICRWMSQNDFQLPTKTQLYTGIPTSFKPSAVQCNQRWPSQSHR